MKIGKTRVYFIIIYCSCILVTGTWYFKTIWPLSISALWFVVFPLLVVQSIMLSPTLPWSALRLNFHFEFFFILFIFWAVITSPFGYDPVRSLLRAGSFVIIYLFVKANCHRMYNCDVEMLIFRLSFIAGLYSIFSLFMLWLAPEIVQPHALDLYRNIGRFKGMSGNANPTGLLALNAIILHAMHFVVSSGQKKMLALVFAGASIFVLMLSASRASLLALAIFILTGFIIKYALVFHKRHNIKRLFYITTVLFCVVAIFFVINKYVDFIRLFLRGNEYISSVARLDIWQKSVFYGLENNFIFGEGLGNSCVAIEKFGYFLNRPHNTIVALWLETGFIGVILFLLMTLFFFYRSLCLCIKRPLAINIIAFSGMTAIWVNSNFEQILDSPLTMGFFLFFFLFFIMNHYVHNGLKVSGA